MSAPSNSAYVNGLSQVSGDQLNSFPQWTVTYAQIKSFAPNPTVPNLLVYMEGYSAAGDGGQGFFYWSTTTGTDDSGLTTIVPSGSTAGCWVRIGNSSTAYTPQTVSNASGGATLTAANVINQVLIFSGGTAPTNTFPTAAAIIGALSGMQVGSIRDLLIINENSGTTTLAVGSGVTFSGNALTMATATQRLFKIYIASASAVTVYG